MVARYRSPASGSGGVTIPELVCFDTMQIPTARVARSTTGWQPFPKYTYFALATVVLDHMALRHRMASHNDGGRTKLCIVPCRRLLSLSLHLIVKLIHSAFGTTTLGNLATKY
jgi:hypothetical protein